MICAKLGENEYRILVVLWKISTNNEWGHNKTFPSLIQESIGSIGGEVNAISVRVSLRELEINKV